ncbi:NAD(P)-dependent oxidoreductase [Actinoplanes sp. TBRC 11911]|uniref:NAD(P)-dependent oxidoreductase n=1 Tax=Actinoplanes sp. TBRC 11911 TaxID=2729386 RepID=UPI00145EB315|nr:NAD(P)-dependent oxidoreductase [Actinoplanes sp. TBRC 11911]NMO57861.1 NAD(P)-dependent oxidoreductase [Actinoplanes sp. TBRC 11911]
MTKQDQIGFVGYGDQGGPMARAIAEAGLPLHAWARRPESMEILQGVPHIPHPAVADLAAACDILCLCLPEDEDVRGVVADGRLLDHMKPGSVLVNHGTGQPAFARELSRTAAEHGVEVLDAPVSGARAGAIAKTLITMVGGSADVTDRCRPVFETFSSKVVQVGGAGTGQMCKLFNNALMMMNQRNIEEIVALAQRVDGLELPALFDVLRSASATSFALEAMNRAVTVANADHLTKLELLDMELFAEAMATYQPGAQSITERAVAGARGLVDLANAMRDVPVLENRG